MYIKNKILILSTVTACLSTTLFAENWSQHLKGTWGLGASVLQSNYANTDSETTLAPYIFGSIGKLQIEANRVHYPLHTTPYYSIFATGNYRSQQYSEALGLDRSIEAGLTLDVPLSHGFTSRFTALGDISRTHNGYELEAQLYRHDNIDKLSILTAISAQYQDKNLANYYYATDSYTADDDYVFEAELIATYPIGDFAIFAGVRSYWYADNVTDSPLASSSNTLLTFFGVGYRF